MEETKLGHALQEVTESEKTMLQLVATKRFLDLERVPLICNDIAAIKGSMDMLTKQMVTQDQFWPIKTLVYGFVGITLIAVIGGLLTLILKK